jgi:hypothetical protein
VSAGQLPPGVGSRTARWLFSEHFLAARLPEWDEFSTLDPTTLHSELRELWRSEGPRLAGANEAQTEDRLVRPTLRRLGHELAVQIEIPGTGRRPDYLLFASEADLAACQASGGQALIDGAVAVAEAKRFDQPLDRRAPDGDPVAQIRDYVTYSRRPFGILTNGRVWRLYWRDSPLVERPCHEVDLEEPRARDCCRPAVLRRVLPCVRLYAVR